MRSFRLSHRLTAWATIGLTLFQPMIQATSLPSAPVISEESSSSILSGKLNNGFVYTVLPTSRTNGTTWIKLGIHVHHEKEDEALSKLLQHALFYGTEQLSRQAIIDLLNPLGLDIDADSYVKANEEEHSIQIGLQADQTEHVDEIIQFMQQLAFQPVLKEQEIELARQHILKTLSTNSNEEDQANLQNLRHQIQNLTVSQVRDFHAKWYRPDVMHLVVIGPKVNDDVVSSIYHTFAEAKPAVLEPEEAGVRLAQLANENLTDDSYAFLMQSIEVDRSLDGVQTIIIDGKILMNEPNWINKSSNGKFLGAILTAVGIGSLILIASPLAPVALLVGSLSTATGVYFLSCGYLKDPCYVEAKRQMDLKYGFEYAYKNGRAGVTLTPYERRYLFLQEMVDHPEILSKDPILLLADLYLLSDPNFASIFYTNETDSLYQIKRDFIQYRNQYKILMQNIEQELLTITSPYTWARDDALNHAQYVYEQNYYVVTKQALKEDRDQKIEQIECLYASNEIDKEEREAYIRQEREYYEEVIHNTHFQNGLQAAENTRFQMELEIQSNYQLQVELCKQSIQYYERMAMFENGQQSLIQLYNGYLFGLLRNFPVYDPVFPDFLDLRS